MARSLRLLGALFAATAIVLPLALKAAPPQWWTDRGVTITNAQANDYAAVNQGQLKNIAKQALAEMDAHLPVNSQDALHLLVAGWNQPAAATNDYVAVNLGQVKSLAKLFYARFQAEHYTDRFPWTGSVAPANDYAPANIGQVKNLFSFDFTLPGAGLDLDHDGLPDQWEIQYFGHTGVDPSAAVAWNPGLTILQAFLQGLNPNDFYNGQAPTLAIAGGDGQTGPPNGFVPLPLLVSVANGNGNPLINAPVTFAVTSGGGQMQKSSIGTPSTSLTLLTDYTGQARVFFQLPNAQNNTSTITATPGSGTYSKTLLFTEHSNAGGGSYRSPFAPTNVTATLNANGSMDVTWTNNADPADPETINIQDFDANGVYHTIATAPAGSTSIHIPAP